MKQLISCCGTVCSDCEYYPNDCAGCAEIKGNVFWLQYMDAKICPIFDCCVNNKQFKHCGMCERLPCDNYGISDPTKSEEDNAEILEKQLNQLKTLKNEKPV